MQPSNPAQRFALAVHGGAGVLASLTADEQTGYQRSLRRVLRAGAAILSSGGTALDAVETAVMIMEEDPLFNCGKGAVFNHAGFHELDAAIMDGRSLACGAVAGVRTVKSPVHLARLVMEQSPHVFLTGRGAEEFAETMNAERVDNSYFSTERRRLQWQQALADGRIRLDHDSPDEKMGTVGAVALDAAGNLAAATSTGGITNKQFGRVGDSPVIGAGTYANNATCAISCTGKGEEFIRRSVAFAVHAQLAYGRLTLEQAAGAAIYRGLKAGDGGLIAVDRAGNISMPFNTRGMFRGMADSSGKLWAGTFRD
jgi:Asparaginase